MNKLQLQASVSDLGWFLSLCFLLFTNIRIRYVYFLQRRLYLFAMLTNMFLILSRLLLGSSILGDSQLLGSSFPPVPGTL